MGQHVKMRIRLRMTQQPVATSASAATSTSSPYQTEDTVFHGTCFSLYLVMMIFTFGAGTGRLYCGNHRYLAEDGLCIVLRNACSVDSLCYIFLTAGIVQPENELYSCENADDLQTRNEHTRAGMSRPISVRSPQRVYEHGYTVSPPQYSSPRMMGTAFAISQSWAVRP